MVIKQLYVAVCMVTLVVVSAACTNINIYERTEYFPTHTWADSVKPSFTFNITDTTRPYNLYIVLRHTDAYHFNNMWVNVTTQAPQGKPETQMLELPLATNANGWLAKGMDDIFEHRIRINQYPVNLKLGTYQFTLQHTMRENPLTNVLNAGIRVERVQ